MALQYVTTINPGGVGLYVETTTAGAPTGTAEIGSIAIVAVSGSVTMWINTNGSTTWRQFASSATTSWLLQDNVNPAFDIGSTGLTNLLRFITTDAAEQVVYNGPSPLVLNAAGALLGGSVVGAVGFLRTAADGFVDAGLWLRKTFTAGDTNTDVVLPARSAGSWRVVDAYIVSGGGTGGSLQLKTAGGAANISDAMVPGNADVVTRAASIILANATIAAGGTLRLDGAAGSPGGTCFVRIEPV